MRRVILIGGGKSVLEGIETGLWDKIFEEEIWSLNYAFRAMPYLPKREVWVDTTFFRNNIDSLQKLHESGVECHAKKNDRYLGIDSIIQHSVTREPNEKDSHLFTGHMGLCGMFALSLAVKEKYDEIYLLGYDFGTPIESDIHTHFYQDKTEYISSGVGRPQVYLAHGSTPKKSVHDFDIYKNYQCVYNVSTISHIDSFPKITYQEFYDKIKT